MADYLGIDYGSEKIGLAVADDETRLATPFKIIRENSETKLIGLLLEEIKSEKVKRVVVGVPFSKSGAELAQTRKVKNFIVELKKKLPKEVPLVLEDERMSTKMSRKLLSETKTAADDAVAAAIVLQGYLDRSAK